MRRPEFIARQSGHPRGILGRLLLSLMERETAPDNDRALTLLAIEAGSEVIEIGCGHGRSLEKAAALATSGFVAGIDGSAVAVARATQRVSALIRAGRAQVAQADSSRLPFADARFDRALAMHTIYFWKNPAIHLREIARVLQPRARLVLGFRRAEDLEVVARFPATVYHFRGEAEVRHLLAGAGFTAIDILTEPAGAAPISYAVARRARV